MRGTKAEDVLTIPLQIPEKERLRVKEVTADLSDTMAVIVHTAFLNAILTLDCFHIMKRCIDGVEEIRLRYRRNNAGLNSNTADVSSDMPHDADVTARSTRRTTRARLVAASHCGRTRGSDRPR